MSEVVEIDSVACKLSLDSPMPPCTLNGIDYTYKAAALLNNGNMVLVFVPSEESSDEL